MPFKITSWNINSLRLRLPLLKAFVEQETPDVVCLQEIKVQDSDFPLEDVKALGYPYVIFKGQKSYNGVAILSKTPLSDIETHPMCSKDDCRHISATANGFRIHNFYVPAGGDEPDREINDKFGHKLDFLKHMQELSFGEKAILVGDLNIAPHEHDVWSSKALKKTVSHTPLERELLIKLMTTWVDAARHLTPEPEKLYSWWSYRSANWQVADKGRRLDHIWVTPDLKDAIQRVSFHREMRAMAQPSDHVPVMLTLS
jgi:exodeoxyribonuclease III